MIAACLKTSYLNFVTQLIIKSRSQLELSQSPVAFGAPRISKSSHSCTPSQGEHYKQTFFFNQLTPGNKWGNCPSASKAPGCCWWQGNRLNRFHIFVYNQNSLTAEPSRQTWAPPGVPMCFLPPLCLPAGAIQPPARLQGAALPSSMHGGAAPGCGNQTGRGIPTQGSTSGAFLNQLCSCSVSHDEMLREREEKSHSKIPWGGRDREKTRKFRFCDLWTRVKAANSDNLMFVTFSKQGWSFRDVD